MTEKDKMPLVSVAMPVYNEEKYIEETLECVINQDYLNLEILISDNHSTDKTGEICKAFAEKDKRISYHCHDKNIGVAPNHVFTTQRARGKYFMWAAGHDKWSENFISQSVFLLEKFETATIAFGTSSWIDEDGRSLARYSGWYDTRSLNPVSRFFMVFWGTMNPILGLFRRKDIPDLRKYNYAGADLAILGELSLKGVFIHAVNASFYRRQNREVEDHSERMRRYSKEMQIGDAFFSRIFPLLKLPFELLRIVLQAKIDIIEKICILILLLPSLPARYIIGIRDSNRK